MASSVQFSIRSLLILMVVVSVVSAVLAPRIQGLEPEGRLRLLAILLPVGAIAVMFAMVRCLQRRRAEKAGGQVILRTDAREKPTPFADFITAVVTSILATKITFDLAVADKSEFHATVLFLGTITLVLTLAATELCLHWWWRTGPLVTEVFSNGLVLRGAVFRAWSTLLSYDTSPEGQTVLLLYESSRRGPRQRRIHIAAKDQAEVERILIDNGVPFALRPIEQINAKKK